MEEDCGNGSALRIRPEPSKLRTVCPEGSQKEPHTLSLAWSPVRDQSKKEAEVSLPLSQEKTQLYRPRSARQKQAVSLVPLIATQAEECSCKPAEGLVEGHGESRRSQAKGRDRD